MADTRSALEAPNRSEGGSTVTITNVAWVRDHHRRAVLELELDRRPAHIRSGQKSELLERGIVAGIVFFASERSQQLPNTLIRGDFGPELTEGDLIGCTDDPGVFALYEEMCRAIRAGTWQPGPRPPTV
jgi:hypothetical protein